MPGFFITNIHSKSDFVLEEKNEFINGDIRHTHFIIKRSVLKSFLDDKIFSEDNDLIVITDGIIYNSDEFAKIESAEKFFFSEYKKDPLFFSRLNGHFSGAFYDKKQEEWLIYTSIFGDRSIFYYFNEDTGSFIIGSELRYVIEYMRKCGIERHIDFHGMKCLLDFGYFLDTSTGIKEVKRLFPGDYMRINSKKGIVTENYFMAEYAPITYDENSAIEKLDKAFSNALNRIYRKNVSDNRIGIADLSGGLDSRMICYGFNRIGSSNNIAVTYAQSDSSDEAIAKKIASNLGLEWLFLALDSGNCLKDIDELTLLNNGTSYYFGITGGKTLLESINHSKFGIEATGILGDVHESAMIEYNDNPDVNVYEKRFKLSSMTSLDMDYSYSKEVKRFRDNESYWYYIRGALAGMSTFHVRRNYVEPVTPFADKEFLEAYLSIPWDIRCKERVLLKWMIKKYPEAVKIPYAATGMSVINENKFIVKVMRHVKLRINKIISDFAGRPTKNSMNPLDFWISQNANLKEALDIYYNANIFVLDNYKEICSQVKMLYDSDKFVDKGLGLFIISYIKNYIK